MALSISPTRRALLALTAGGVLFGLTVPLSKIALGWLDPAWLGVVRFGLAAPALAWVGRHRLRAALSLRVVAWGGFGYGAMVLLQNAGLERTSAGHAAVLCGAVPVLVALVATVAGQGTSGPLAWVGFTVALGGVGLVAGSGGGADSLAGDALMLLSCVAQAGFVVAQARLLDGRDPVAVTAIQMAAAAVVALGVALPGGAPVAVGGGGAMAAVAALVVAGTLVPFALFAFGQTSVRPEVAGAFVNIEPLVGAGVAVVAFGDAFGVLQAVGGLAILAGIALSSVPAAGSRRAAPASA
jgi:O-acetylserine/cysteine efflux transporter